MNTKKVNKFLLFVFFAAIPTQLGYFFWPEDAFVFGARVDYLAPKIFLSDILLILLIIFNFKTLTKLTAKYLKFVLVLVVYAILNLYISQSFQITFFKWIKVFELLLLIALISQLKTKEMKISLYGLSTGVFISFFIAMMQFVLQRSIGGIFYYLGERTFTATTPGIATAILFGKEYLRSYATFPHPNALAGFVVVSLFLVNETLSNSLLKASIYIISITTILLTFSKAAIVALLVTLFIKLSKKNITLLIYYSLIIISLIMPLHSIKPLDVPTVDRRMQLIRSSGYLFSEQPIIGNGLGNFLMKLPSSFSRLNEVVVKWWIQPVHNIFLLMLVDVGVVGLSAVVIGGHKVIKVAQEKSYILLPIIITGFLDHYWLTLQQTMLLLGVVMGFLFNHKIKGLGSL